MQLSVSFFEWLQRRSRIVVGLLNQQFLTVLIMACVLASCQLASTNTPDGVLRTRVEELMLQPAASVTLEMACESGYRVSDSSGSPAKFLKLVEVSQRDPHTVWFTFQNKSNDTVQEQVLMRINCKPTG